MLEKLSFSIWAEDNTIPTCARDDTCLESAAEKLADLDGSNYQDVEDPAAAVVLQFNRGSSETILTKCGTLAQRLRRRKRSVKSTRKWFPLDRRSEMMGFVCTLSSNLLKRFFFSID